MKKRILILGGGNAQLPLIQEAIKLDCYVIVCSNIDCIGKDMANAFYYVDTKDKEEILKIAIKEKINAIISNSEYAMESVSYVATELNLICTSPTSVETLQNKYIFRQLQKSLGLYTPQSVLISNKKQFLDECKKINFPIIVKPCKSCASKGVTLLNEYDKGILEDCFNKAIENSFNKQVLIEEYVEKTQMPVIEADVFVYDNKYLWLDMQSEPYPKKPHIIPPGACRPPLASDYQLKKFKKDVKKIMKASGITFGQFNVETFFTKNNDLFIVEINPRQAGSTVQKDIEITRNINSSKLLISCCLGMDQYFNYLYKKKIQTKPFLDIDLFPRKAGIFKDIHIDESIRPYLYEINKRTEFENYVCVGDDMSKAVASVSFSFDDIEKLYYFNNIIEELVYPVID